MNDFVVIAGTLFGIVIVGTFIVGLYDVVYAWYVDRQYQARVRRERYAAARRRLRREAARAEFEHSLNGAGTVHYEDNRWVVTPRR